MTGKERVYAALSHRQPDRVPFFEYLAEYTVMQDVLGREVYWRAHFKEVQALWEGRRDELVEGYKRDLVEFARAMDWDGITVGMVPPKGFQPQPLEQLDELTWRDWQGNVYRYSELTEDLMLMARQVLDSRSPPPDLWEPPPEPDPSEFELIDHVVAELGQTHFIISRCGRYLSPRYPSALGMEARLLALVERPDDVRNSRLQAAKASQAHLHMLLDRGIDAVFLEEDFGSSTGPMMSPRTFRDVILPALKVSCSHLKQRGAPVFFHSCGAVRPLLDMFIEAGVDCYQSIQPEEDIIALKRDFQGRLCLWGGIDTDALVRSTPDRVYTEVAHIIQHCKPGGGFILGTSHSLMVGCRADNYLAAATALRDHGWACQ